jgi:hypothetical protein
MAFFEARVIRWPPFFAGLLGWCQGMPKPNFIIFRHPDYLFLFFTFFNVKKIRKFRKKLF